MEKQKFKGVSVIVAALICILVLWYNRSGDVYSVQFDQPDFRQVYLEEYSGDQTSLQVYVPQTADTVSCLTRGPISLKSVSGGTEYFVELQYKATENNMVFKIFAADYISTDNSGGRILVNKNLDPAASEWKTSFVLDQSVDSVFISIEGNDPGFVLGRVNLDSSEAVFTDTWFLCALTVVLAALLLLLINSRFSPAEGFVLNGQDIPQKNAVLLFLFLGAAAVFVASLPVLDQGIILGHDTRFHMNRIEGIARGLQSGQFPVRIHGGTLNDYGYPNSLFYPELLLYIPAWMTLLGVSVFTAYKLYFVFVNVLTIWLSYAAFKRMTSSRSIGFTLAVVYLLAPYRLLCAYWRQAVGEFTAMTFLPLVVYGLYAVLFGEKKDWYLLTLGAAGVLQSHILSTEMTAVFAVIFVLAGAKRLFGKEKRILELLYAAVFTVAVNLWLLGPMVLMMLQLGLIVFSREALTAQKATFDLSNLFAINKIEFDGPYSIGIILVFAIAAYIIYRLIFAHKKETMLAAGDILCWCALGFMWSCTALFPWAQMEKVPVIGAVVSAIQFPTRMLTVVQLCGTALLGFVLVLTTHKCSHRRLACIIVACLAVYTSLGFMEFTVIGDGFETIGTKSEYANNIDNQFSVGQAEYLVEGSDLDAMIADPPVLESDNPSMTISGYTRYGTKMSFRYAMDLSQGQENRIILPVTYIPNYEITVDGQRVYPTKYTDGGRVAFAVPAAEGSVTVRYTSPLIFRACEVFSLAALAAFGLAVYCTKKQVTPLNLLKNKKN